jgi:hypothetical protein
MYGVVSANPEYTSELEALFLHEPCHYILNVK